MVIENNDKKNSCHIAGWGVFAVFSVGATALGVAGLIFARVVPNQPWLLKHRYWLTPSAYAFTGIGASGMGLVILRLFAAAVCRSKQSNDAPWMNRNNIIETIPSETEEVEKAQQAEASRKQKIAEIKAFLDDEPPLCDQDKVIIKNAIDNASMEDLSALEESLKRLPNRQLFSDDKDWNLKEIQEQLHVYENQRKWADYLEALEGEFGQENVKRLTQSLPPNFKDTECEAQQEHRQKINPVITNWRATKVNMKHSDEEFRHDLQAFYNPQSNPFAYHLQNSVTRPVAAMILQIREDWATDPKGFFQKHAGLLQQNAISAWVIDVAQNSKNLPQSLDEMQALCARILLSGQQEGDDPALVGLMHRWLQEALGAYEPRNEEETLQQQWQRVQDKVQVDFFEERTINAWNNYWKICQSIGELDVQDPQRVLALSLDALLSTPRLRPYFFGDKAIEDRSKFLESIFEALLASPTIWKATFVTLPPELVENVVRYVSQREGAIKPSAQIVEILHRLDHLTALNAHFSQGNQPKRDVQIFMKGIGVFFSGLPNESHLQILPLFAMWVEEEKNQPQEVSQEIRNGISYYHTKTALQALMRFCHLKGELDEEAIAHDLESLSNNLEKNHKQALQKYRRYRLQEYGRDIALQPLKQQDLPNSVERLIAALTYSFDEKFFSKPLTLNQVSLFTALLRTALSWNCDEGIDEQQIINLLKKSKGRAILKEIEAGKTPKLSKESLTSIEALQTQLLQQKALAGEGSVSLATLAVSALRTPGNLLSLLVPAMKALKLEKDDKAKIQESVEALRCGLEKSDILAWGWHYVRTFASPWLPILQIFKFRRDKGQCIVDIGEFSKLISTSIKSIIDRLQHYQDFQDFGKFITAIEKDSKFPMGRELMLWLARLVKVVHQAAKQGRIQAAPMKAQQTLVPSTPALPILEMRSLPWTPQNQPLELTLSDGTIIPYTSPGKKGELAYFNPFLGVVDQNNYDQIIAQGSSIIYLYQEGQDKPFIIGPAGYDEKGYPLPVTAEQKETSRINLTMSSFVNEKIDGLEVQLTPDHLKVIDFLRGTKSAIGEWKEKKEEGGVIPALAGYLGTLAGKAVPWVTDKGLKLIGGSASVLGFAAKYTLKPMIWGLLKAMDGDSFKEKVLGLQAFGDRYIESHLPEWFVRHQFFASGEHSGYAYPVMIELTKTVSEETRCHLECCIVLVGRELLQLDQDLAQRHVTKIKAATQALIELEKKRLVDARNQANASSNIIIESDEKALVNQNELDHQAATKAVVDRLNELKNTNDTQLLRTITRRAFEIFLVRESGLKASDLQKLPQTQHRKARINAIVKKYGLDVKKLDAFLAKISTECRQRHQDKSREYVKQHFEGEFRKEIEALKVGRAPEEVPILPTDEARILHLKLQMEQERREQTTLAELYADIMGSLWDNFHTLANHQSTPIFGSGKRKEIFKSHGISDSWKSQEKGKVREAIKAREHEICNSFNLDDSKLTQQIASINKQIEVLKRKKLKLEQSNKNGKKTETIKKLASEIASLQDNLKDFQLKHEDFLANTPEGITNTLKTLQKDISARQSKIEKNEGAIQAAQKNIELLEAQQNDLQEQIQELKQKEDAQEELKRCREQVQTLRSEVTQLNNNIRRLESENRSHKTKIKTISSELEGKQAELNERQSKVLKYEDIYLKWQLQQQALLLAKEILDPVIDLLVTLVWGVVQNHENLGEYQTHFAEFADGALDEQAHPAKAMQGALRLLGRLLQDIDPYINSIYDTIDEIPKALGVK